MNAAVLLLVLLGASPVSDLKEILEKFEKQPYEQYEREKAIRALGKLGSPDSTRALEGLLEDPFVHLRDEAVSALIQLKRRPPEERLRSIDLLGELLLRRREPETRRHLATALGLIGDKAAVTPLASALRKEKDPATLAALANALRRLGGGADALWNKAQRFPPGRADCLHALEDPERVLKYRDDPDDAVRAAVVDVLARRKREILPELEIDRGVGERLGIALADALTAVRDPALARRRAAALLRHGSWRVRAAAVAGVERLRDPTLVGDLVELMAGEPGRLRHDAWAALRRMTGKDIPPDPEQWRAILPVASLAAEGIDAADPETTSAYYGLPVYSRRIAFVFDVSGSMRDDGKIEGAREQFAATVQRLESEQRYDLFVYRYLLEYPPRPRLERAFGRLTSGKARKSVAWLGRQEAKGAGALYDALLAAMLDEEVDTIYLLSDGVPSFGTVKRDYRVLQEIRRLNRWRRVVIHTILLGTKGTDREFMAQLAGEHGGAAVDAQGRRLG